MNKNVEAAFNAQINKEFYSAYLYLSMSTYFQDLGLAGFANWMKVQFEEETFHAMKMIAYVQNRRGKVTLEAIEKPDCCWNSPLEVFEKTLEHEEYVTSRIYDLMDVAKANNDKSTESFLSWFIDEQVEEESAASEIIDKLKLVGKDGNAIYMMNDEFATRVFTPPVQ